MTGTPIIDLTDPTPTVATPDRRVFRLAATDLKETVNLHEPADNPKLLRLHRLQWLLAVRLEETHPRTAIIRCMPADRPWLEPVTRAGRFSHTRFQWISEPPVKEQAS
ncbi:hypothetical protein [Bifidobacterium sp. SO1]|uniref:hypothetical protein n=1 Tax=Bifidobacterium sp. SO1 TaxID=2809029 RepID=UPI001BDC5D22|nr:hypothetical protein [Bifidobacterium sp. SO1]MBT1161757.1 hypothetical protein [Bifidobacterium sp. SO1]